MELYFKKKTTSKFQETSGEDVTLTMDDEGLVQGPTRTPRIVVQFTQDC